MYARIFAFVALAMGASACSSSSGTPQTSDGGGRDVSTAHDTGTPHDSGHPHDAGTGSDAAKDTGASHDAGVGKTCFKLLLCDQACTTSACTTACYDDSTGVAQGLFNAFNACIESQCSADAGGPCAPDASTCSTCQMAAATGKVCLPEFTACSADAVVGPPDLDGGAVVVPSFDAGMQLACGALASCESACADAGAACPSDCAKMGTPEAQSLYDALSSCLSSHCPAADGGPCESAGSACSGCRTQAEFDPSTCGDQFTACQSDRSNAPDAAASPVALTGGTLRTLATGLNQPQIVLVQSNLVYYSQVSSAGDVSDVGLTDGGAPVNIGSPQPFPMGLAVDPSNIYVWNSGTFSGTSTLNNHDGTVVQLPLAGGTAVTLRTGMEVAYAAPYINAIVVSGSTVFWVEGASGSDGTIMMAPVGGGTASAVFTAQPFPEALATDGTDLYWTRWGTFDAQGAYNNDGAVLKGSISGGAITTLATAQSAPGAIAVDAQNVYWSNVGHLGGDNLPAADTGSIMQTPKSGSGTPTLLSGNEPVPLGIVVSGSTVYWTRYTLSAPGEIASIPVGGGTVVPLVAGLANPFSLAVVGSTIVWSDSPPTQSESGSILALDLP